MPPTRVRVVGSGYTTIEYAGRPIAFLDSFLDSGQIAFGAAGGSEGIYTLDANRAVEIAVGRVLAIGTITAAIRELWNQPVWYQLQGLAGRRSITEIWEALRTTASPVTCRLVIRPPGGQPVRGKIFHGCVITGIDDGEEVSIGALSVTKNITIAYTHTTAI